MILHDISALLGKSRGGQSKPPQNKQKIKQNPGLRYVPTRKEFENDMK